MANDARSAMYRRIHAALQQTPDPALAARQWMELPRAYRRATSAPRQSLIAQLTDRLEDYEAAVFEMERAGVPELVSARLRQRGFTRMLLPAGFPSSMVPDGFCFIHDEGLDAAELNAVDGVMTLATLAIAETGTVVLQGVPGQGRRAASLVPDFHLCLVDVETVVGSVPEAVERLQATATLPTTWISGPSATADIEMTRIKGVHGPRFLDVVLYR